MKTESLQRQQLEELRQVKAAKNRSPIKPLPKVDTPQRNNPNAKSTARKSIKGLRRGSVQDENSNSMDDKSSSKSSSSEIGDLEEKIAEKPSISEIPELIPEASGSGENKSEASPELSKPEQPPETNTDTKATSELPKGIIMSIEMSPPPIKTSELLNPPLVIPMLSDTLMTKPSLTFETRPPMQSMVTFDDDLDSQSSEGNSEALKLALASVINYELEDEEPPDWEEREPPLDEEDGSEVANSSGEINSSATTEFVLLSSDEEGNHEKKKSKASSPSKVSLHIGSPIAADHEENPREAEMPEDNFSAEERLQLDSDDDETDKDEGIGKKSAEPGTEKPVQSEDKIVLDPISKLLPKVKVKIAAETDAKISDGPEANAEETEAKNTEDVPLPDQSNKDGVEVAGEGVKVTNKEVKSNDDEMNDSDIDNLQLSLEDDAGDDKGADLADSKVVRVAEKPEDTEAMCSEAKDMVGDENEAMDSEAMKSSSTDGDIKDIETKHSEAKDAEAKDTGPMDREVKDPEAMDSEAKDPETLDSESKDAEAKDTEVKDPEAMKSEAKDTETKGSDAKDNDVNEAKDSKTEDISVKESEAKDSEAEDIEEKNGNVSKPEDTSVEILEDGKPGSTTEQKDDLDISDKLENYTNDLQIDESALSVSNKEGAAGKSSNGDYDMVTVSDSDDKDEMSYRESKRLINRIILDDSDPIKALLEETEGMSAEELGLMPSRKRSVDDDDDDIDDHAVKKSKVISPAESEDELEDREMEEDDESRVEPQKLTMKLLEELFRERIKEFVEETNKNTILQLSGRCSTLEKNMEKWKKKALDLENQVVELTAELQKYKQQVAAKKVLEKPAVTTTPVISSAVAGTSASKVVSNPVSTAISMPSSVLRPSPAVTKTTPSKASLTNMMPSKVNPAVPLALIANTATKNSSSTIIDLTEEDEDRAASTLAMVKKAANSVSATLATLPAGTTILQTTNTISSTVTTQATKMVTLPMVTSGGIQNMVQLIPATQTTTAGMRMTRPRMPGNQQTAVGPFTAPPGTQVTYLVPSGPPGSNAIGNLPRQLMAFPAGTNLLPGNRAPMQTILVRMNAPANAGARFPGTNVAIPTTGGNITMIPAGTNIRPINQYQNAPRITQTRAAVPRLAPTPRLQHPAPLPAQPFYPAGASMKALPPKPALKISKVANGIVLSWNMATNQTHADISAYQLYAYQEGSGQPSTSLWKKVGDVKALPLPMACTLTQFLEGNKYHFAVRASDIHNRCGPFSEPTHIMLPNSK